MEGFAFFFKFLQNKRLSPRFFCLSPAMVFSAPESLQAGKPDMSKAFQKPKNPVNSVNTNGNNNTIAKHKKKNKIVTNK